MVSFTFTFLTDNCWAVADSETVEATYNFAYHMINSIELKYDAFGSFRKAAKILTDEGLCREEVCPYTGKKGTFQKVKSPLSSI